MLNPDREFAHLGGFQLVGLVCAKRILNKVLNRGEHAGNHVGVLNNGGVRDAMSQKQAGGSMNEEDLLNAIEQAAQHHDFGERSTGGDGFPAPCQTAKRKTLLNHAIE